MKTLGIVLIALNLIAAGLHGQIQNLPYGAPLSLEKARAVLTAAQDEARKHQWAVAIAVVDAGGHLVAFARMDTTQYGSVEVALEKARTSAGFRRPSKAFQDNVAAGGDGLRVLNLPGAIAIEGGLPLVADGKIVGAIGVSGVTSAQDGQIAAAGAAALAAGP